MATVDLVFYPDVRLKRIAEKVEKVDGNIKQTIADMFETNYTLDHCAALAATQLNFDTPKAITVIDLSYDKTNPVCLVNPEIIHSEGEQYEYEGCMSVGSCTESRPSARVKRAMKVRVKALDKDGNPIEFEASGYMARCIQHELDHLNGKIFLDRLSPLKRTLTLQKLEKLERIAAKRKTKE